MAFSGSETYGMHENYDAETEKPLAAPNFVSWNILVGNMLEEATIKRNPQDFSQNIIWLGNDLIRKAPVAR